MPTRRVLSVLCALLMLACQPVDDADLDPETPVDGAGADDPVGAPQQPLPASVDALLGELAPTAAQWQAGSAVADVVVELDDDRSWTAATVTYLAPDADRFLLLGVGGDGVSQERPTLEGLDLRPLPPEAIAELPDPEALLDPDRLLEAAGDVLDECGVGDGPVTLIYATGAPAAWDGRTWTEPPRWQATVSGAGAAVVDPTKARAAAAQPCVAG